MKGHKKKIPAVAELLESTGPDHKYGFSIHLLEELLTKEQFADFKFWIRHQTIHIEGSIPYYFIDDVSRWSYGMERWRVTTQKV